MSLIKNLPLLDQISAWARETTLLLKASLFVARALTAARPMPERSVKRPMRSGVSPSLRSREMGSKRSVLRESRWGTRRIRWDVLLLLLGAVAKVVARTRGVAAGMGDDCGGV